MCQCDEVISKEEEKSMDIPNDAVGSCCFFDSSDTSICKDGMCYGQCKELRGCWNEDLCEDRIMDGESLCCNDCRGRSKCTLGSTTKKKLIKIIKDGNNKTKFRSRVDGVVITPDSSTSDTQWGACCNFWRKTPDGGARYYGCTNTFRGRCREGWGTFNAGTRCRLMKTPCPETASYGGCCVLLADGTYDCVQADDEQSCNGVWMGEGSTCIADEGEHSCAEVHQEP